MRRLESFRAAAKYGSRDTRAFASDAPERSSTGKSRDAFGSGGPARSRPDAGRNAPSAKSLGYEVSRIEAPRVRLRIREVSLKGKMQYDEPDYTGATAFMIGNEGNGLTEKLSNMADTWVKIPMEGKVESLNAAIAASILMFETARQRRA